MAISTCVNIELLVMGPIENNVYLLGDGDEVFVVDPTCDAERIMEAVGQRRCTAIVLTHAHWDHVGAAAELRALTGAQVVASAVDAAVISGERELDASHTPFEFCPVDLKVADGERVELCGSSWEVLETPGHTPGSICLFLDEEHAGRQGAPVLVAGDTLFAGAHGRTDFTGGSPEDMSASLMRLADLPAETIVLPGHNSLTSIGNERFWLVRGSL